MNTKYQAATAGPAQAQGRAGPGPARARPRAWAGPAAVWYFVFILYILDISWIYLAISGYMFGFLLLYIFGIFEFVFSGGRSQPNMFDRYKIDTAIYIYIYIYTYTFAYP